MSLRVGADSDVGKVRGENEDAYGSFTAQEADGDRLFIVADGMGGYERGREASTTTVDAVRHAYVEANGAPIPDRLRQAFREANRQVYALASDGDNVGSMGTTGTALVLSGDRVFIAHVGDSRVYRFADGTAEQLTDDHTVAQRMRRRGRITAEEARTHPRRGTLTRAIGMSEEVDVDVFEAGPPSPGDHYLLCTDGLTDLPEDTLRDVVLNNDPQTACETLIEHANDRGGYDNSTALVVAIH